MVSIWSKRGRILLGAVGFVLVTVPVIAVPILVSLHTRDLAQRTVTEIAGEVVSRTEVAIDSGLMALTELSLLGVAKCDESDLDLMRRTVYSNFWIKEVGIARRDGQILCNHIGDTMAVKPLSSLYPSRNRNVSLQLVEMGASGRRGLMLVWAFSPAVGLTAIVPGDTLSDGALPRFLRDLASVSISLTDGSMIGGVEAADNAQPSADRGEEAVIEAYAESGRYPIRATLSAPLSAFGEQYGSLLSYAQAGSALLSAVIFALFVYVLRGPPVELARLSKAVARGEIVPYYQPIIDIGTGRLTGCEVLVRWRKPNGTLIAPDMFIGLAEASSVAWPLTLMLMRRVRADLEPSFGKRSALKISINLFNAHFGTLRTVRDVENVFGGSALSYRQLVFELTERQPLGDIGRARVVIRRLQDLGARVALDDAGTGHAGLAYLHQLGVDIVKIDKLFVDTIGQGRTATPIIDSLIKLGHDLGMEVVAEGVETFEQLDYLREHGADSAQGYLFSPPLPSRAFLDLVEAMEPLSPPGSSEQRRHTLLPRPDLVAKVA